MPAWILTGSLENFRINVERGFWPQGRKTKPEPYPWRVEAEPVLIAATARFE